MKSKDMKKDHYFDIRSRRTYYFSRVRDIYEFIYNWEETNYNNKSIKIKLRSNDIMQE